MNHRLVLSIPQPCTEKYSNFERTLTGGFCNHCQKEVADFSKMKDPEIIDYFKSTSSKTCGRFRKDQLKTYSIKNSQAHPKLANPKWGWTLFPLSIFLFLKPEMSQAQFFNKQQKVQKDFHSNSLESRMDSLSIIKGTVLVEDIPLPGVSIALKGTMKGTSTNKDGEFTFKTPLLKEETLQFSFIGYKTKEIKILPKELIDNQIDLNIILDEDDMVLMGEVEVAGLYQSKKTVFKRIKSMFR